MKLDLHYTDPRLVALYDGDNPRGADTDFYVALAAEIDAQTIVDLGCGTGVLTRELAGNGRTVIGVDPAAAMLAYAQQQPGAERVQWVAGDASAIGSPQADLVVMTGNVAQVFLDDAEWLATLRYIHAALRPGGYVAFESRNPAARAWESWNRKATYERLDTPFGELECWLEVTAVSPGFVSFEGHNLFVETGEVMVVSSELRFRSLAEMSDSLRQAGFAVAQVYGDWHKGAFAEKSPFMVFVARRV